MSRGSSPTSPTEVFWVLVDTVLFGLGPLPLDILLRQFSERSTDVCHVGHELLQILDESEKCLQFSLALRSLHVLNCSDLLWICFQTFPRQYMSDIGNLVLSKLALAFVELQTTCLCLVHDLLQAHVVFCLVFSPHHYIVHDGFTSINVFDHLRHHSLKYFACRDNAKGNTKEAITSEWSVELAQLGAFFVKFQLISLEQQTVQTGKFISVRPVLSDSWRYIFSVVGPSFENHTAQGFQFQVFCRFSFELCVLFW